MRGVALVLSFATLAGVVVPAAVHSAPATDVARYCAALFPPSSDFQLCVDNERDARDRLEEERPLLATAGRQAWEACHATYTSWQMMEFCLRGQDLPRAATEARPHGPPAGAAGSGEERQEPATTHAATGEPDDAARSDIAPETAHSSPNATAAGDGSSAAVTVWGPEPRATPPAESAARPSAPVPAAEVARQVEGVLERTGARDARCDTKPYGPGWAAVCQARETASPR